MSLFFVNLDRDTKKRFGISKFMEFLGDNYDPLTSDFLLKLPNLKIGGEYKIQKDELRPDNISFNIYGDTQYWWVIMLYNGINELNELTSDKTIIGRT